ncbi:hypothetical protein F4777DRAFT_570115 [Nemania sp. FL0916]|nr:hypothetical protein F4777DRAFT_570115 [Nemania sp. FL0916]
MDPLTAIGLASNIIAFVDFASKLIYGAHEVYSSNTGRVGEYDDLAQVIGDVESITRRLGYGNGAPTDDDIAIRKLAANCRDLSDDLIKALNKLRSKKAKSGSESFRVAWRSMREKGGIKSLEERVNLYRRQILDRIIIMMSEKTSSVHQMLEESSKEARTSVQQTRRELRDLREAVVSSTESLRDNNYNGVVSL